MAVYDTEENKRTSMTEATIKSLIQTVNFEKHRLFIVDNGSCKETLELYEKTAEAWALNRLPFSSLNVIKNTENLGTAKAVNMGWKMRKPGENCIKMDNDVVIHQRGWVDMLDEAIKREPLIGQIGLKRKDCWEYPTHPNKEWQSRLIMLPHEPGQSWIIVEQSKHIIGTCVMHSSALIDKIGYLYQPSLYGYDDVLMSWRSNLSGFFNCFLSHVDIDHIDPGGDEYTDWKQRHSGEQTQEVIKLVDSYIQGASMYYD